MKNTKKLRDMTAADLDNEIAALEERFVKLKRLSFLRQQVYIVETGNMANEKAVELINNAAQIVAQVFGVKTEEIFGPRRTERVATPRQVIFYVARKQNLTLEVIGMAFGKNHGTVMHGINRIEERSSVEPLFKLKVESVLTEIRNKLLI